MFRPRALWLFGVSLALALAALTLYDEKGIHKAEEIAAETDQLDAKNLALERQVAREQRLIRALRAPSRNGPIERVIREELGYIKKNEKVYSFGP